jgi:hypothetical protein
MPKLNPVGAWLVVVVLGAACTACSNDASSHAAASPTQSSAVSPASGDVPPPPKVGQCRNTPARNLGSDDWVDRTPVLDCSRTHTLETIEVIKPVTKLTLSLVKQLVDACHTPASADYLGLPTFRPAISRLLFPAVYWPSPAQRAAGQVWVRCDVGVQATTHCCRPVAQLAPQTASLRGMMAADPGRFQWCIGELPAPSRSQRLTSCKKPHRSEALPTPLQMDVTQYPSAAVLDREGRSGCADLVKDRHDVKSLVLTPAWTARSEWSGGTLFGVCWIHRNAGLLPPIE